MTSEHLAIDRDLRSSLLRAKTYLTTLRRVRSMTNLQDNCLDDIYPTSVAAQKVAMTIPEPRLLSVSFDSLEYGGRNGSGN